MVTELIAKALCLYYLVMGIAFLVNRKQFITVFREVMNSQTLLTYSGVIALIVGILLVTLHNVWVWGSPLLVTAVAWLAFIKGAVLLICPKLFNGWTAKLYQPERMLYLGCFMIALALVFGYIAF